MYLCRQIGNDGSQGGQVYLSPQEVKFDDTVNIVGMTAASVGQHVCSWDVNGRAWCWGLAISGQLGQGNEFDMFEPASLETLGDLKIAGMSAYFHHTCCWTDEGDGYCW